MAEKYFLQTVTRWKHRKENNMKFNDILMAIDNDTKIRVTITQYGMKFSTNYRYREYFLNKKELDELTGRRIRKMKVDDGILEVVL